MLFKCKNNKKYLFSILSGTLITDSWCLYLINKKGKGILLKISHSSFISKNSCPSLMMSFPVWTLWSFTLIHQNSDKTLKWCKPLPAPATREGKVVENERMEATLIDQINNASRLIKPILPFKETYMDSFSIILNIQYKSWLASDKQLSVLPSEWCRKGFVNQCESL